MKIAVASDHGGFPIKARIIEELRRLGHEVLDLGTNSADPVDYPDYAKAVAEAVLDGRAERAILLAAAA
jgi:ribose 5-phosphate isomerase B